MNRCMCDGASDPKYSGAAVCSAVFMKVQERKSLKVPLEKVQIAPF